MNASTRPQDPLHPRLIVLALVVGSILVGAVGFYTLSRPREPATQLAVASGAPVWRVEGQITDAAANPIADACVAIGPRGCQRLGPHSGADGHWSFDFPQVAVTYDLHFMKDGYRQVDMRIELTGPRRIDVVLQKNP